MIALMKAKKSFIPSSMLAKADNEIIMPNIMKVIFLLLVLILAACADAGGGSSNSPASIADNATSIPPTATFTPGPVEFTATAFVAAATATGEALARNPAAQALPTEILAAPLDAPLAANCIPGEFNSFDGQLSERIQTALDDAGIKDAFASVLKVETTQNCVDSTVIQTIFAVNVMVSDLTNESFLIGIVENVLQAMSAFPPESSEGLESAIFSLRFDRGQQRLTLEGEYALLRAAYTRGLRGKELMQVVGGLK